VSGARLKVSGDQEGFGMEQISPVVCNTNVTLGLGPAEVPRPQSTKANASFPYCTLNDNYDVTTCIFDFHSLPILCP
jgi:hypothetical protein